MATVDWLSYLNTQSLLPPRSHVVEANQFLGERQSMNIAVDCGCGAGRDALYLLEQGFQVYAFDKDLPTIEKLAQHSLAASNPMLDVKISSFGEYHFPRSHLVNASACLFYSEPNEFAIFWKNMVKSLFSGGIFCGHFIGKDDIGFDEKLPILTHTKEEIEDLLEGFYVIAWQEKRERSSQLTGEQRYWTVYTVTALKK
ncbi:methyltransferase domain-containing protein [Photobacterium sanguinicancri]|uniref:methyltransferase domain-containing protein n=1 Tax=Photobacterium sanguinicancri TaxID=875932 RepID=UPI003D11F8D5